MAKNRKRVDHRNARFIVDALNADDTDYRRLSIRGRKEALSTAKKLSAHGRQACVISGTRIVGCYRNQRKAR